MSAERDNSGGLLQAEQVLDVDRLEVKREYAAQIDAFYKKISLLIEYVGKRDEHTYKQ